MEKYIQDLRNMNNERGKKILRVLDANYKTVGRQAIPLSLEDKNVMIKEVNIHYNQLIKNYERR